MQRLLVVLSVLLLSSNGFSRVDTDELFTVKAKAKTEDERTKITELGIAIDSVFSDSVSFLATQKDIARLKAAKIGIEVDRLPAQLIGFPEADAEYHNYQETNEELDRIAKTYPDLATRFNIGKSLEGRTLEGIRLSGKKDSDTLPTAIFMGCHHAREHLSVEVPLRMAAYLAENYSKIEKVKTLLDTREVWIVPMVNPDGAEHDISGDKYKYWRKNRRDNGDKSFGIDLNRNYGPKEFFGGPGSSHLPYTDIYHGPHEFSEPETQAVRDFVRSRKKATTLITFHTFSELILWPYGHTKRKVESGDDVRVFETMGKKMATMNGYTPKKSSGLYLNSGDTTDWAYKELRLFAFTFELSPSPMQVGGFYPGAKAIEPTFKANIEPMLYLMEYADNPYRVLKTAESDPLGLTN